MQFENLTITGFGPYADSQEIDFLQLASKGLFSVTGETGAGKTTIFDALTYALYGEVPGSRSSGSVRSEHASPSQPSRVELLFNAGNERWRVVRTPQFERAKSRGSGTTTQRPEATLHRFSAGGWEPLTSNLNEINEQCAALAGLTRHQFERVGLLPQGEFKRLLHAKSKERKELFRSLFGTANIDAAVQRLVEDARATDAAVDTARTRHDELLQSAAPLLDQLSELAEHADDGVVTLPGFGATPQSSGDPIGDLLAVATDVEMRVLPQLRNAETEKQAAAAAAHEKLGRVMEQAEHVESLAQLRFRRSELDQRRPAIEDGAARAERAMRAKPLVVAHRQLLDDQASVDQASKEARGLQGRAVRHAEQVGLAWDDNDDPAALHRRVTEAIPAVKAAAQNTAERQALVKRVRAEQGQVAATKSALKTANERFDEIAEALSTQAEHVGELELAAAGGDLLLEQLSGLEAQAALAAKRDSAAAAIEGLRARRAAVVAELTEIGASIELQKSHQTEALTLASTVEARARALESATAIEQRLTAHTELTERLADATQSHASASASLAALSHRYAEGVAPRLASELIDGEPCLVCGSEAHPAPARANGDVPLVDQAELSAAQDAANECFATLRSLQTSLDELHKSLDPELTIETAAEAVREASARVADAVAAQQRAASVTEAIAEQSDHRDALKELVAQAEAALQSEQTRVHDAIQVLAADSDTPLPEFSKRIETKKLAIATNTRAIAALGEERERTSALKSERFALINERTALESAIATSTTTLVGLDEQIVGIDDRLSGWAGTDLLERLERLESLAEVLEQLTAAAATLAIARDRLDRRLKERTTLLESSGFPTLTEALETDLADHDIARMRDEAEDFAAQSADCDAQLRQLAELSVPEEAPDVEAMRRRSEHTKHEATAATTRRVAVEGVLAQAQEKTATSIDRQAEISQLVAIADRRRAVADLCDAKGDSRIGLEGFILRSHLEEVVTQANLRLDSLSRGRYRLVLADRALDKRAEWGLDLTVVDSHTGTERAVTTLSGGETFYTSLGLALGLSDVLSNRGATTIRSVFIDEGFGSLDDSVIDDTIDVLSQLRADGVTIGVITHVAAMRDALPAGLVVEKLKSAGSRVVQAA